MVVIDAVVRLIPGVLGDEGSSIDEASTTACPNTRSTRAPANFRGMEVPSVLLSGDHGKVDAWRRQQSLIRTARLRPDLLESVNVSQAERVFCYHCAMAQSKAPNGAPFYLRGCTFHGLWPAWLKRRWGFAKSASWVFYIVFVIGLVWLLQNFVVCPYTIPSGSMEDTIEVGDNVWSEKITYYTHEPQAGDIVTFEDPEIAGRTLIKRVIATGGQTVDLIDGTVYIDGVAQNEPLYRRQAFRAAENRGECFYKLSLYHSRRVSLGNGR